MDRPTATDLGAKKRAHQPKSPDLSEVQSNHGERFVELTPNIQAVFKQ